MSSAAELALLGARAPSYRVELLDADEHLLGPLVGFEGGRLEWNRYAPIRSGGNLTLDGPAPEWGGQRIRVSYVLTTDEGEHVWPRGIYLPSTPSTSYRGAGAGTEVELFDKLLILDEDEVGETFAVEEGASIIPAVRAVIAGAGETSISITDSGATLANGMVFEAGTSRLAIANKLLAAAHYFSLWCDGAGAYRADPYALPAQRPTARELLDNRDGIYLSAFTRERDTFKIPNRINAIQRPDDETGAEPLTYTADLPAEHPFSAASRGGRVIARSVKDLEVATIAELQARAERELMEAVQFTAKLEITHAWVPLELNEVIRFRSLRRGIDTRATLTHQSVDLRPTALVKSTFEEVS